MRVGCLFAEILEPIVAPFFKTVSVLKTVSVWLYEVVLSDVILQTRTVFTRLNAVAFIKFLAFPMRRLFQNP